MKKLIYTSTLAFFLLGVAKAQSIEKIQKNNTPKTVDKNLKKMEKKSSKAEMLMEREQEEKKTEEQARPNPMKSKGNKASLNPQPYPPADIKTKNIEKK
jgi:hypothetical protein